MAEGPNLAETILGKAGFPLLMRVFLPGVVGDLVLEPFTGWVGNIACAAGGFPWSDTVLPLLAALTIGSLFSMFGDGIYRLYEARILWPRFLRDVGTRVQESRLNSLKESAHTARKKGREIEYDEISYLLRRYPTDDLARPIVVRPTMLGNIVFEYEAYPGSRYGIDSVFYWPRLWLMLDKDEREWINSSWSVADGLLYASAAAYVGTLIWIVIWLVLVGKGVYSWVALVATARIGQASILVQSELPAFWTLWLIPIWLGAGYVLYRLSLPYHQSNGEVFKSLFDMHREKLEALIFLGLGKAQLWEDTRRYLQYLGLRCRECGHLLKKGDPKCPKCGLPIIKTIEYRGA